MNFEVKIVNGVAIVVDSATGEQIKWIDTVNVSAEPGQRPMLLLGVFNFTCKVTAGNPPATPPAAP